MTALATLERQAVLLDRPREDHGERVERHLAFLDEQRELGERGWDSFGDVIADLRLPSSARRNLERARRDRLAGLFSPKAAFGPFRQMYDGAIVLADQTAVTGTSETALFPASQYTAFAANQLRAGQIWQLIVAGIGTTPASSQGNITLTPRYGTTTGGTSLGASPAVALVASATNLPWQLEMYFVVRSIGNAGNNSNVIENGNFTCGSGLVASTVAFGSTASVAVDASIAAGLFIGITLGSASDSFKAMMVVLESLN